MWKISKMLALVATLVSASGCQLLIDNRSRGSGAVVVVPSDEWDAMRQTSLVASQMRAFPEATKTDADIPAVKIEPTPGSETITFSNYTSASLGGCVTSGVIELQHRGGIDDAIILLKNEAFRLNNNMLIMTKINNIKTDYAKTINVEARMLACPAKLAKGN